MGNILVLCEEGVEDIVLIWPSYELVLFRALVFFIFTVINQREDSTNYRYLPFSISQAQCCGAGAGLLSWSRSRLKSSGSDLGSGVLLFGLWVLLWQSSDTLTCKI